MARFSLNRIFFLFLFLVMCLTTGCEVFSVRAPEAPGIGNQGIFIQPDTPDAVLENLMNAIKEMNAVNYVNCLDPAFVYEPSGQGNIGDPSLWRGWGRTEEDLYFKNLVSTTQNRSGHSLTFENIRRDDVSPSEQRVFARYTLVVNTNRNLTSATTNQIVGEVFLILRSGSSGLWSIHSWSDLNVSSAYNWTQLRAEFVRG